MEKIPEKKIDTGCQNTYMMKVQAKEYMKRRILQAMVAGLMCARASAQVNSGSNGSDGAFNPATSTVINMADHPNGIYQYTSINIPNGVTVTFIPNANNTPVLWLVQNNVVINGTINLVGQIPTGANYPSHPALQIGGIGGPGGGAGGNGGNNLTPGQGPGGGGVPCGGGGYGISGQGIWGSGQGGQVYGNSSLIPLLGGSGGAGGGPYASGGGGGGGAILINASGSIELNGRIDASGTLGFYSGGSSGGAVRLVTPYIFGSGSIWTLWTAVSVSQDGGGLGRVRIDAIINTLSGEIRAVYSQGLPPLGPIIEQSDYSPASVFCRAGAAATFSVSAEGQMPLHYQWYDGTGILANETSSSLTINNAQTDANYYVVVSNPYGSVTSQNAQLKILIDYNADIPPVVSTKPVPPAPRQPNQHNLVVVTHGWELGSVLSLNKDAPQWVYDMGQSIAHKLPDSSWTVYVLGWNGFFAAGTVVSGDAASRAENIGKNYGMWLSTGGWSHVHFIGHSAGAILIQTAAEALKANSASPVEIHTTFLDPYDWVLFNGHSRFGAGSDWSDNYFEADLSGPLTGGQMDHSYNVDVTGLDPIHNILNVEGQHGWAYEFYSNTITGGLGNTSDGFGFPLSKEGGNWNFATNAFRPGNTPYPLGGSPTFCTSSSVPVQKNSSFIFNALSYIGNGVVNTAYNTLDMFTTLYSPLLKPKIPSTNSLGSPAWLSLGIIVTNRVNFLTFDAQFTSATNAGGLLTVYWNTNEIGVVDETVATPGLQNYSFSLPATYTGGSYVLGFRLDAFTNIVSSMSVTNIALGYAGLTNPITLGISRVHGTNHMTLTGPTNYNYLIQSSSDFVDWIPAAIVPNTNGTVLFSDPAATNYDQRFYRAVSP